MREEMKKIISNPTKAEIIKEGHSIRMRLLKAIEQCDEEGYQKIEKQLKEYITADTFDLIKRVSGNPLRSYKNFLLSHNSLYAYAAERGRMSPALSHYMSEKYAILIESKNTIEELQELHDYFLKDYLNANNRIQLYRSESLSIRVLQYISANFMNQININQIANEFFVTRVHLMRIFKKETGMTINEAITSKRFEEACILLRKSDLTITEIALMVGFNSPQYFSNFFYEKFGMTPTNYRKENQRK